MSADKGPCFSCKSRELGCHSSCENYKIWKENLDKEKAMIRERKKEFSQFEFSTYDGKVSSANAIKKHRRLSLGYAFLSDSVAEG